MSLRMCCSCFCLFLAESFLLGLPFHLLVHLSLSVNFVAHGPKIEGWTERERECACLVSCLHENGYSSGQCKMSASPNLPSSAQGNGAGHQPLLQAWTTSLLPHRQPPCSSPVPRRFYCLNSHDSIIFTQSFTIFHSIV